MRTYKTRGLTSSLDVEPLDWEMIIRKWKNQEKIKRKENKVKIVVDRIKKKIIKNKLMKKIVNNLTNIKS